MTEVRPGRQYRVELFGRGEQRLDHRLRVAGSGVLDGDANHSRRLQIHRLLGPVRQMGPAVLHLCDLRIRVLRMGPVLVGPLLRPLPVQAGQLGARRRGDAGRRGQSVQKRLVLSPTHQPQ